METVRASQIRTVSTQTREPDAPRPRRWGLHAAVFLVFAGIALAAYWPILPGQYDRIPTCSCGDPAWQTWLLGWVPYAIAHGHNPLYSLWTNYPVGVNLAQNTEMPLLALIMAPITVLVSPVLSYNLLLWLSFPLSAWAMFFVLRRWTDSTPAAFAGGLLYGFSAYVVGQAHGHLMLAFVPLPPLYFYQLHKLLTRRDGSPYRDGFVLGLIAVAQFFISAEILATLVIMSAFAAIILAVSRRRHIDSATLTYVARGVGACGALLAAFVVYPIWVMLTGPAHFTGPVRAVVNDYKSVLLSPVVPSVDERFPSVLAHAGRNLNPVENGAFLGIPLLVLLIVLVVRFRRNRWVLLCAGLGAIAFVLSLGARLTVLDRDTTTPLPFALLAKLPLLDNLVASRITLYEAFFAAVIVGLAGAELAALLREQPGRRLQFLAAGCAGVAALGGLALVPRWPYHSKQTAIPYFFRSSLVNRIPDGSVALTYPFPRYPDNQAMMWEAVSHLRFKEIGTYALVRDSEGHATGSPPWLVPTDVQTFLIASQRALPTSRITRQFAGDVRIFATRYRVAAVVVDMADPRAKQVSALFTAAFGRPQLTAGGVELWLITPGRTGAASTPRERGRRALEPV